MQARIESAGRQMGIKLAQDGPWQITPDKWEYKFIPVPSDLCNLCGERVAQGKKPACVHHCQAQVLEFGPIEELVEKMTAKGRKMVLFVP